MSMKYTEKQILEKTKIILKDLKGKYYRVKKDRTLVDVLK